MPSLLVTAKMHPALAARVKASLQRRRGSVPRSGMAPTLTALVRLALVLTVLGASGALLYFQERNAERLRAERSALVAEVRAHSTRLRGGDGGVVARVQAELVRASSRPEPDHIAPGLRSAAALDAVLARPTIYVRGPVEAFASSSLIAPAAAASWKDALVHCLLSPPASRTEKDLLRKVRAGASSSASRGPIAEHVSRLHDAEAGLPFLLPAFEARVVAAGDLGELTRLRSSFERAPIAKARVAARAELLLFAMDEPGDARVPAELDGERAHWVRVGLIELSGGQVLLRLRRPVDPEWISAPVRAQHASALDSCALAMDIRSALVN
ncbi:MAG TPA: hypothetical protein VER33_13035 [Polyangiaceae bacterium]|nr:hypothetical protein [Polyangiaceae bacterium]